MTALEQVILTLLCVVLGLGILIITARLGCALFGPNDTEEPCCPKRPDPRAIATLERIERNMAQATAEIELRELRRLRQMIHEEWDHMPERIRDQYCEIPLTEKDRP